MLAFHTQYQDEDENETLVSPLKVYQGKVRIFDY
jgi:hypothetical protein